MCILPAYTSRRRRHRPAIDYRTVPGSFPNPVVSVGVCYTAVDAAAGGLTTGWWAVVLECISSHPLPAAAQEPEVLPPP